MLDHIETFFFVLMGVLLILLKYTSITMLVLFIITAFIPINKILKLKGNGVAPVFYIFVGLITSVILYSFTLILYNVIWPYHVNGSFNPKETIISEVEKDASAPTTQEEIMKKVEEMKRKHGEVTSPFDVESPEELRHRLESNIASEVYRRNYHRGTD